MKRCIVPITALLASLLLCAGPCVASGTTVPAREGANAKQAAASVKLVDINTASKAQLKKLPGIDDAQAEKIIEGRPYLSKSHLVTRGILPFGVYQSIKDQVMAKPKAA